MRCSPAVTSCSDVEDGNPDGICQDAHGAVWTAVPEAHELRRILPGGTVTHRARFGTWSPLAPALGGPDRSTLYVCVVEFDDVQDIINAMADPTDADQVCRGRIDVVEGVDVAGAGWP